MRGLAIEGLTVRFGEKTAVDDVTLAVAPGETLALLGPSGCGKSTLLRAIAGVEPLASGSVVFDGEDVTEVPVHRRGFGLMFQDGQLFAHRDVAGNVAYGLESMSRRKSRAMMANHHPISTKTERRARVAELLGLVGLAGYEGRSVTTLSGGERQRVALARSLAPSPRLLMLDEPLSALDRELRERLAIDVRDILRATGTTAIFVTHDRDEASVMADRVSTMRRGKLRQIDVPD